MSSSRQETMDNTRKQSRRKDKKRLQNKKARASKIKLVLDPNYIIEMRYRQPSQRIHVHPIANNLKEFGDTLSKLPELKQRFTDGIFGHLLNLKLMNFPSKLMHHLVLRRVHSDKNHTLRFNFQGREVEFGEEQFAIITGLKCGQHQSDYDEYSPAAKGLMEKFFPNKEKVRLSDLKSVLNSWILNVGVACTIDQLLQLSNLYFLEAFLLPRSETLFIETRHIRIASDVEEFNSFPWGRVVFNETLSHFDNSVKSIVANKTAYALSGFPYALLAWAYEIIPLLHRKKFGERNEERFPQRVLNWVYDGNYNFKTLESEVFESEEFDIKSFRIKKSDRAQWYMAYFNYKHQVNVNQVDVDHEQQIEEEVDYGTSQDDDTDSSGQSEASKTLASRSIIKKLTALWNTEQVMKQQIDELKTDVKQMLGLIKELCKMKSWMFGSPCHNNMENQGQHSNPVNLDETNMDGVVHLARKYVDVSDENCSGKTTPNIVHLREETPNVEADIVDVGASHRLPEKVPYVDKEQIILDNTGSNINFAVEDGNVIPLGDEFVNEEIILDNTASNINIASEDVNVIPLGDEFDKVQKRKNVSREQPMRRSPRAKKISKMLSSPFTTAFGSSTNKDVEAQDKGKAIVADSKGQETTWDEPLNLFSLNLTQEFEEDLQQGKRKTIEAAVVKEKSTEEQEDIPKLVEETISCLQVYKAKRNKRKKTT